MPPLTLSGRYRTVAVSLDRHSVPPLVKRSREADSRRRHIFARALPPAIAKTPSPLATMTVRLVFMSR